MLEDRLEQDIKSALLAHDAAKLATLRTLKAALLNLKVATGKRETGISDEEVMSVFAKEAKKRQESADLYVQGGDNNRAQAELSEKALIETYLPPKMSDEDITRLVKEIIEQTAASGPAAMGQVIGEVKKRAGAGADGGTIAKIVKEQLT